MERTGVLFGFLDLSLFSLLDQSLTETNWNCLLEAIVINYRPNICPHLQCLDSLSQLQERGETGRDERGKVRET